MRKLHLTFSCLYFSCLALCGCETYQPPPDPEERLYTPDMNRFEQLPTKGSTEVYRRAGASLGAYQKILLQPLDVQLRSGWNPERDAGAQSIRDARDRIAFIFKVEMIRVIEASQRYTMSSDPAPDVLEVRPQIIDLYVKAIDDAAAESSGVSTYEINDAELTFAGDLRDSVTGTLLYRFYDHRTASVGKLELSSVDERSQKLRQLVAHWAEQLLTALDNARAASEQP